MKKVLFTLAALMMAGSLCAEEYMYIEDFEVSQELLAQTSARQRRITVPVKAHFDNYVSAWTVDLMTNGQENVLLPNMSAAGASEGADMTMAYIDELCNEKTITVGLNKGQNNTRFIAASTVAGYYWTDAMDPDNDDPVTYGANKWIGDYENMFTITFQFEPGFEGGVIQVRTQPASGQDPRGPITNGETVTKTFNITVEQAQVTPEDFVGTADVTFDANGLATISYTSNDPNATVEVTMNGNTLNVTFENGVATWQAPVAAEQTEAGDYSYTVAIKVTPDGENFVGEPAEDSDTYAYTVEKTATPVITVIHKDGSHAYFTVEGAGDVVVLVDGEEAVPAVYNGVPCYVVYSVLGEPVSYEVTATAKEDGKLISDEASETISFEAWDGVDELVNGKAVAGVRYFNMAGQEMQQANGVTIVVTTYTDGTTSAVKVMK